MKKLVFSTFAVVAISSVSMANNQFETNKNSENMSIVITDCENWAMDQMLLSDPTDQMPPEVAHDEYRSLVELCDSH